jgi:hypothetical protein
MGLQFKGKSFDDNMLAAGSFQVLALLALPVQKYKY